jgi:hypothetical protein
MGKALAELLPLIIGAALVPAWIVVVLFLLRERGLRVAASFVGGTTAVRLMQGILFGLIFYTPSKANGDGAVAAITSTLLLVVGILLLTTAVKQWRRVEDPDAPPPRWRKTVQGLSAIQAFVVGALLVIVAVKPWVFTLSALAVIEQAPLSPQGAVAMYLLFVLAAQSLLLAPITVAVVAPVHSVRMLGAAQAWLERNGRVIVIVFSTIIGAWFVWKGISGIKAHLNSP